MTDFNLFRAMRDNRAENDERIASERKQAALNTLRFVQFVLLFVQLAGQILRIFFPENELLNIPHYVYILLILPFIVDPLYASAKGHIGAIRSDSLFFIIGMIEFGYTAYVIASYFGDLKISVLLGILLGGMALYYLLAYMLLRASAKISAKRADDTSDN